jgi:hypothetical protein
MGPRDARKWIGSCSRPGCRLLELIYNRARQHQFVLVRSPPMTGKTSTTQLLAKYLIEEKKCIAFCISPVGYMTEPRKVNFDAFFESILQISWIKFLNFLTEYKENDIFFLLDEAQVVS